MFKHGSFAQYIQFFIKFSRYLLGLSFILFLNNNSVLIIPKIRP